MIAKNIRGDLKSATDAGLFPDGTSFGVTIDKYSGGQSIRVIMRGLPNRAIYQHDDGFPDSYGPHTPYAIGVKHLLKDITDAYNSRDVDGMTDYYNVAYSGNVELEDEQTATWRAEDAARRKAKKS